MEVSSFDSWELACPNITSWVQDLTLAPSSKELRIIRDKIYDLSKRIDVLTRPPTEDDEPATPEQEAGEEDEVPVEEEPAEDEEEEEPEPELMENENTVSHRLVLLFPKC